MKRLPTALDYPRAKAVWPIGADADIVVLNPSGRWTVDGNTLLSSAGWSPYHGMALQGQITHVFLRGRPIVDDGDSGRKARLTAGSCHRFARRASREMLGA